MLRYVLIRLQRFLQFISAMADWNWLGAKIQVFHFNRKWWYLTMHRFKCMACWLGGGVHNGSKSIEGFLAGFGWVGDLPPPRSWKTPGPDMTTDVWLWPEDCCRRWKSMAALYCHTEQQGEEMIRSGSRDTWTSLTLISKCMHHGGILLMQFAEFLSTRLFLCLPMQRPWPLAPLCVVSRAMVGLHPNRGSSLLKGYVLDVDNH